MFDTAFQMHKIFFSFYFRRTQTVAYIFLDFCIEINKEILKYFSRVRTDDSENYKQNKINQFLCSRSLSLSKLIRQFQQRQKDIKPNERNKNN